MLPRLKRLMPGGTVPGLAKGTSALGAAMAASVSQGGLDRRRVV